MRYRNSLFLFRRDLRLVDNTALEQALEHSKTVAAAFVFDPRQTQPHPYRSAPGLWFLRDSLRELDTELAKRDSQLFPFEGAPDSLVEHWVETLQIEAIWVNRDYTPFSRKRDHALQRACERRGIAFHSCADLLLNEPSRALKANGQPYTVFTPYYNNARALPVQTPRTRVKNAGRFAPAQSGTTIEPFLDALVENIPTYELAQGGRTAAKRRLSELKSKSGYAEQRDLPALDGTSSLSPHLKFGTCSIREAYAAIAKTLGNEHPLIRQLYWRDFLTHIAYHFPRVFGNAFKEQYDRVPWKKDKALFKAWKNGTTGFPIVDAGMRQLNQTGFMHNRVRMVVASFLTKDLHIDWRWGERYFATRLVDYDPCVNNGNWQWAASTGCDAQPYFRIFNPWRQQERFDPDCEYIKRWIPELASLAQREIHRWQGELGIDYPPPILEHKGAAMKAKMLFDNL